MKGAACCLFWGRGYALDPGDAVLEPVRRAYRRLGLDLEPGTFRSHSDASLLRAQGMSPLVLGPGSLRVAHRPDERVAFREVVEAARIYRALIREACC